MQASKPILVVEDSTEDFIALDRVFRKYALPNPILRCDSGDQALDYLQSASKAPGWPAKRPVFMLLDLNLPGTDGLAVLEAVKRYPLLASMPVIVLSSSADAHDIETCYRLGANSYLTKPLEFPAFEQKIISMMNYWLGVTELPY